MKKIIICIMLFICAKNFSQISKDKGYIIFDSEKKITTDILNKFWQHPPNTIEYFEKDIKKTIQTTDLKEFAVRGRKFVRKTVELDISADKSIEISAQRKPVFISKEILLEVILETLNIKLYSYLNDNYNLYFIEKNNIITPLINKKYITNSKVKKNKDYRIQLSKILNRKITDFKYKKNHLVNNILNSEKNTPVFVKNQNKFTLKELISISPKLGISSLNYNITSLKGGSIDAQKNQTLIIFGGEIEVYPSIFNKKISLVAEVNYNNFSSNFKYVNDRFNQFNSTISLNQTNLNIPLTLRYYFYLNQNHKIFLGAVSNFHIVNGDFMLNYDNSYPNMTINSDFNGSSFGFSAGYTYKKYSLDLLFQQLNSGDLRRSSYDLTFLPDWNLKNNSINIMFRYQLF